MSAINVGDVEAILRLKDEFSAVIQSAMANSTTAIAKGVAAGNLASAAIGEMGEIALRAGNYLLELGERAMQMGANFYDMSNRTGISVESLSKISFVASQTGTSLESITQLIYRMQISLGGAVDGTNQLGDVFDRLGLSARALASEKPEQAFIQIISALRKIPSFAERAKIGQEVFSRAFRGNVQLLQEDIGQLMKKAEDLGLVLDTKTAAAADIADDAIASLKMQVDMFQVKLVSQLFPSLVAIVKLLEDGLPGALQKSGLSTIQLGDVIKTVAVTGIRAFADLLSAIDYIQTGFRGLQIVSDEIVKVVGQLALLTLKVADAAAKAQAVLNPAAYAAMGDIRKSIGESIVWLEGAIGGLSEHQRDAAKSSFELGNRIQGMRAGADALANKLDRDFSPALKRAQDEINAAAQANRDATAANEHVIDVYTNMAKAVNDYESALINARTAAAKTMEELAAKKSPLKNMQLDESRLLKEMLATLEPDSAAYKKTLQELEAATTKWMQSVVVSADEATKAITVAVEKQQQEALKLHGTIAQIVKESMALVGRDPSGNMLATGFDLKVQELRDVEEAKLLTIRTAMQDLQRKMASGTAGAGMLDANGNMVTPQMQLDQLKMAEDAVRSKFDADFAKLKDAWLASGQSAEDFSGSLDGVSQAARSAAGDMGQVASAVASAGRAAASSWSTFSQQAGFTGTQSTNQAAAPAHTGLRSNFGDFVAGYTPGIPWWSGGMGSGTSWFQQLPHFAKGGRVTEPTLAIVGEGGPETITPDGQGNITVNVDARGSNFNRPSDVARLRDQARAGAEAAIRAKAYRL